jgi:hypothetical protein
MQIGEISEVTIAAYVACILKEFQSGRVESLAKEAMGGLGEFD